MFRHRTRPGRRVRLGGRTISGRLMLAVSGAATVPLVLTHREHIGGFDGLD